MAGRKSDFTLTKLDDLFSTQEQRDEEKLSKIRDIPLTEIDDFPDHPFKVRDDEDMAQLIESIKERGVITPATVRQKEDGRYELISGHRRKRACELAGFDTLRCEVVELNRDEATILMVESNYQRSQILPSEKAYAYKMRLEAMKRQGERTDLTSSPVGTKLRTSDELAQECGDSRNQIHRYIRLTNLVPELLEYVDEGRIKMRPAVELSFLDEDSQRDVGDSVAVAQCVAQELGHAQLSINSDSYSRADMGFQAVCIGYMLCKKYGVDTQNFAINRIPEKLAGKEPKDIRYELSKTRNAMADIHSRVSDELYKKKQERSKDYER